MVGSGMQITCSRDELVQKLGVVARAVSTRTAVQILAGVLLRVEGGQLHLAATDMELSLRSSMDAQVEGEGSVVVPGRLLVDLARLLPESDVQMLAGIRFRGEAPRTPQRWEHIYNAIRTSQAMDEDAW